jgi:hypothetical protein
MARSHNNICMLRKMRRIGLHHPQSFEKAKRLSSVPSQDQIDDMCEPAASFLRPEGSLLFIVVLAKCQRSVLCRSSINLRKFYRGGWWIEFTHVAHNDGRHACGILPKQHRLLATPLFLWRLQTCCATEPTDSTT